MTKNVEKLIANPLNPYDEMGVMHNEAMKYIASERLFSREESQQFYLAKMNEYLKTKGIKDDNFEKYFAKSKLECREIAKSNNNDDSKKYYLSLLEGTLISPIQYYYLRQLEDETTAIREHLEVSNGDMFEALKIYISNVKQIENELLSDNRLESDSKIIPLVASSISRYSMFNYLDIYMNKTHPLYATFIGERDTVVYTDPQDGGSIIIIGGDWGKIGNADVKGAVGGIAAGVFGALTWQVVAAAGLGGSVAASVEELYDQWISGEVIILFWP